MIAKILDTLMCLVIAVGGAGLSFIGAYSVGIIWGLWK